MYYGAKQAELFAKITDIEKHLNYVNKNLIDSIIECIDVREFGVVANVYPTVEEMCNAIDKLDMVVDKAQDLESICEDFVDAIGGYRITDFEDFYGNFAKVEYQWEVFPTEEEMICWKDIKD